MKMKILIVPDIHGRTFWKEAKEKIHEVDTCIFLGDYVDPYDYEDGVISGSDHEALVDNVKEIIQFARDNAPKVILLLGNHDAHYLSESSEIQSSHYNSLVKNELVRIINDNIDLFRKCVVCCGYLFSHAGVVRGWLSYNGYTGDFNDVYEVESFINNSTIEVTAQVGRSRWGVYPSGGPLCADISEHEYGDLLFPQIVGHTQLKETGSKITLGKTTCYDSRSIHIVELSVPGE